jgi:alkanesulfonate monooxygenase SsuD/methylene tetrahydromethanopterin reductase-like flavin-dependent oxidoreductase (luciferase family)
MVTADVLSGGRLVFGLGIGWMREGFEVAQRDFRRLSTGRRPEFHGEFVDFPPIGFEPKPPRPGGPAGPARLRRSSGRQSAEATARLVLDAARSTGVRLRQRRKPRTQGTPAEPTRSKRFWGVRDSNPQPTD